ncbi:MAG: hypothetical protein ACKVS9_00040 [Phycisphaerae bacterium]
MGWMFALKWILVGTVVIGGTIVAISRANTDAGQGFGGCDAIQDLFNPPDDDNQNDNSNVNPNDNGSGQDNPNGNTNSDAGTNDNGSTTNDNSGDGNTNTNAGTNANENSGVVVNGNTNTNSGGNTNTNAGSNQNTNSDSQPAIAGQFFGIVNSEIQQSLNGSTSGQPRRGTASQAVEFDDDGRPLSVLVYGFTDTRDQQVEVSEEGDRVTLTIGGTVNVTLTVRVEEVEYTNRSMRMVLALTHRGTSGNLVQNGTGTQTIEIDVSGDEMEYSVDVEYEVRQTAGSINFDTGETQTYTGTLNRQ